MTKGQGYEDGRERERQGKAGGGESGNEEEEEGKAVGNFCLITVI